MKLGLQLGYWGSQPPVDGNVALAQEAERLGYDSVWTAESWGNDVFTPLAWIGAQTSTIKLGTAIAQLSARTPAACAMSALSIDRLSNGRMILGLGVSGPQVVEGWYGQPFAKPLARTREYVDIIRQILRREAPLSNAGPHYPLPYHGPDATNMGKPLRANTHPLRSDLPIYLGAEGPKNVTQTAAIADGWLPLYYNPFHPEIYSEQLKDAAPTFEIAPLVLVNINDDLEQALLPAKMMLSFYVGGMGSKEHNFHKNLMARMGYEEQADKIQELFMAGRRDEAVQAVPDQFADEITLSGSRDRVRERLQAWEESPATTLLIMGAADESMLRTMAELAL
tara:strand:+ start:85966 stop:86979 length:1014 start_codon:yes stop_codon:yes gene_type:complete